ncbi:ABC transporter substrate-binding protein [Dongia soli]|uniref:ABC transporter substrate-binding protein n=1 Tax=Dongia soli TaxID=600628 RepID=A0ABU5ECH0_9PROT|nr:ABC transporter substrate-binding protein [Dongia soli]MDY0883494.1 ABC transporter substrate-binding protein [Dongia soli]
MRLLTKSAVAALMLTLAAGSYAAGHAAHAATPKDILVMAYVIDDLISLDPAEIYEFSSSEYQANVYDHLVVLDVKDTSKILNRVAESWTIGDDGKTWTFKIRSGIKFQSGNELTAEDAAFSLQRYVMLDKSPAFILGQFGLTKENAKEKIRAKDASTLEVELDKAYAPSFFLNCLTYVSSIVDKKLVMSHEKDGDMGNGWLKTHYAGSGPFFLKDWKPNQSLILETNQHYWNGVPKIKRVLIKNVTESATQQLLLQKGDVDIARNVTGDQLTALEGDKNVKMESASKATLWYLGFSMKNQYLSKPEVRKALKYLVDYDGLAKTLFKGVGKPHQTILPEGQLGASDEMPYKLDVAKAKELLKQAGLENGFSVTMDTTNKTETMELAQAIQSTWAQAGVKLEIKPADNKQTLTRYRARQHDIYIGQWGSDYQDPHSNAEGYATNADNSDNAKNKLLAWRNSWFVPDLTKEVYAARDEKDNAKRVEMYGDIQKKVLDDGPYLIMFQQIETAAVNKNVDGFVVGPTFDLNLYHDVVKH